MNLELEQTDISACSYKGNIDKLKHKNKILKKKLRKVTMDLISERGQIRVILRIKPTFSNDIKIIKKVDSTTIQYSDEKNYQFDKIFVNETNHCVYQYLRPFLSSFLDGNNICIFAYGQTGSGKTYTIEGDSKLRLNNDYLFDATKVKENKDSGIVHKMVNKLINEKQREKSYYLSVLEIYNENLIDILNVDSKLPLKINDFKTSNDKNNLVYNLVEKEFFDYKDFARLFELATLNRKTAKTSMNESSSRSHLVYIIKKYGETPSYMLLIDLAGSERVNKANTKDQNFKETTNINSSLSYLGNVFSAINSGSKHIPYRNSKLTTILKSCLDTNNKKQNRNRVVVLCHCSAETSEMNETKGTLEFANKAIKVDLGKIDKDKKKEVEIKKKEDSSNDRSTKTKLANLLKEKEIEISQLKAKTRRLEKELSIANKQHKNNNNNNCTNYNKGISKNRIKVGMTRSTTLAMQKRAALRKKNENRNKNSFKFSPFKTNKNLPVFKSPKMKNNNILYGDFKNNLGEVKKNLFEDLSNENEITNKEEIRKIKKVTFKDPEMCD